MSLCWRAGSFTLQAVLFLFTNGNFIMRLFTLLFASFFLMAAPVMAQEDLADQDPIEGLNRGIFMFNRGVDTVLLRPIAWGYREVVPAYGRDRVGSFFQNLGEPVNFANAVLQGDLEQGFTTFWRFLINSTVGLAGLYDQAQHMGLPYRQEDFGQTLGHYGSGPWFYLVLPIIGPSSGRDAVGRVADWFTNPVSYIDEEEVSIGLAIGEGIHRRASILEITDQIDNSAIDPYATYRSAFLQRRLDLINNGNAKQF